MKKAYFLTGTDTEIGKTFITCALLHRAAQDGQKAAGLKPVAAGTDAAGQNEDVEQILAASNLALPRDIVNPYCFAAAIAPHIAAAEAGRNIDFAVIKASCAEAMAAADFLVVEGAGGFRIPLGVDRDSADLAVDLGLPVILVVGMRLGCISHALLTAEAIVGRGLRLAGWVANRIDPAMSRFAENLATLQELLPAPLLGVVPHAPEGGAAGAASFLNLPG
ncbi:dethiobiotin synthase [Quatrionicoccus australiensis]|uniref:dethiobiotin synthase n=1 Tax=Quatrionicoccus australiensis TaxID=138118 RepID=UPI001CFB6009|nr:dethiobiotin synthase [Quatrionicoccus australiensis]MCB4361460.1 dethiobiotin synthase [Quatrionicoccus australiensis]